MFKAAPKVHGSIDMQHPPALTQLGTLSVARFMRMYWQKHPCVLRRVFKPDFAPIPPDTLMGFACSEDVESRLITHFKGCWRLTHGPFAPSQLPSRQKRDWTLLIQGLDLIHRPTYQLLQCFRFVPDARLDDVMASYAVAGGGVGPHTDSYDVFLLQAQGRRRWRISQQKDTRLQNDVPLRLLAHFKHTDEWVLEPGDMLYLPPGVAHEGVALEPCITLSVGFRTPSWSQMAEPWFERASARLDTVADYRDVGARAARAPAQLPLHLIDSALSALKKAHPTKGDAQHALLVHLTEPKPHVVFDPACRPVRLKQFMHQSTQSGIELDARTRMLYRGTQFAINGECATMGSDLSRCIRALANQRQLSGAELASQPQALPLLYDWYRQGWLHTRVSRP